MLLQPSRFLLSIAALSLLYVAPATMLGQAPQKNYKDDKEFPLYNSILQDTNPKTRMEKIHEWEQKYPQTEFIQERRDLLLTTYAALGQGKETVEMARQIIADDPKNFKANYYTMFFTESLYAKTPSPAVLDEGEKTSKAILANIDTPPQGVTPEQWATARKEIEILAHKTLGAIGMARKNWDAAESEYQKILQINPNNSDANYLLGTAIANEKNVQKYSAALFYLAKVAVYDGPGATSAEGRKQVLAMVQKMYTTYHGSAQGLEDLLALAKSQAAPAANYHIKSKKEIDQEAADAAAAAAEKAAKDNPELHLWKQIKEALTGADGANYFGSSMKDALLPTLKGKVVSLTPAIKPKTLVLALDADGKTADATLKFDMALAGKVEPGTELSFEGVPESYTANPFMVTFNVDKDKLHGWTGKNAPAPPVHRKAGAGSKRSTTAKK